MAKKVGKQGVGSHGYQFYITDSILMYSVLSTIGSK